MFVNDIFSKKLNEGSEPRFLDDDFYAYDPDTKEIKDTWSHKSSGRRFAENRAREMGWSVVSGMRARSLDLHYPTKKVDEAGPFSYGAKKPRRGSVADLAAKKRQEQERGRQPVEPRDQRVGVARVIKNVSEMDKSAPQPGRDGRVSHSTYGSRDKGGETGKQIDVKPIKANKAKQDALKDLNKAFKKNISEGVMDQIKNIYMMLVSDTPMGTPESEFLGHWQRIIQDELGKQIDIDTLARLRDNFVSRYKSMSRRGDVGDWHREMGHDLEEGKDTTPPGSYAWKLGYRAGMKDTTNTKPVGSYAYKLGWQAAKKKKEQGVAEAVVIPSLPAPNYVVNIEPKQKQEREAARQKKQNEPYVDSSGTKYDYPYGNPKEPVKEQDDLDEDWKTVNRKDKTPGMSRKAVKAYRRENPGSKLQTAVTTKPSKLKKGSKSAKRRKSFCARMSGMKRAHAGAKTKRDPDSPINKALRRWNCESIEEMHNLVMIAEQRISAMREGGFDIDIDIPEIPRAPLPRPEPKNKTSEDASKYMDTKPSMVTAKQADELGAMARKAFRPDLNPDYYKDTEPTTKKRDWDYSDPDVQPIVKQWMDKNLLDRKPMTYQQGVDEDFEDLDRYMKAKYGPKPSGGSGVKRGDYGQPGRSRGRKKGELSGAHHQGGGSDVPRNVDFGRTHSERSAGRRMPRFSDDYDSVKRSEVDEGSVQDKLYKKHQELRKKRGAPDPEYYKELGKSYDIQDDQERHAQQAEIKKKYKVTNEDRERYIEELGRAGYEIVNERRMTCPECGGVAYADRMLAEKQDACYHKVKSRYKVWPSAYASGALVRCRKKGAANWGNKSKK